MDDPKTKKLRDYMMKNAIQILLCLLSAALVAMYSYHFKRLDSLEGRVWALEQRKSSVDVLGERTFNLQKQIDVLCSRFEKSANRLEAMITALLKHNGLSAAVVPLTDYTEPKKEGG